MSSTHDTAHRTTGESAAPLERLTGALPTGGSDGSAQKAQVHPGMACVVDLELDVPDPAVATRCSMVVVPMTARPVDRSSGPEPPVPRFS